MHRISKRQNSVLAELAEQGRRIEDLSKKEHDILAEVHPSVSETGSNLNSLTVA
jgi:hypothetical protein